MSSNYDNSDFKWGVDWANQTMHDVNLLLETEINKKPTIDISDFTNKDGNDTYLLKLKAVGEITTIEPILADYQKNVGLTATTGSDGKTTVDFGNDTNLKVVNINATDIDISSAEISKKLVIKGDEKETALLTISTTSTASSPTIADFIKIDGKSFFCSSTSTTLPEDEKRLSIVASKVHATEVDTNIVRTSDEFKLHLKDYFSIYKGTEQNPFILYSKADEESAPTIKFQEPVQIGDIIINDDDSSINNATYLSTKELSVIEAASIVPKKGDTPGSASFSVPLKYNGTIDYDTSPMLREITIVNSVSEIGTPKAGMLYAVLGAVTTSSST